MVPKDGRNYLYSIAHYLYRMKNIYGKDFKLGILGGGQLGRMFIQEAINYNINVHVLDPSKDAPCSSVTPHFTVGDFNDYDTVYQFGKNKDVLTIEIEHVNVSALKQLETEGVKVYPQPSILEMIKDKGFQKKFYQKHGIPTAPFLLVENKQEASEALADGPWMQKLRTGGYDGKGVTPLRNEHDLERAFNAPSVLEKFIDFDKEIAVIVARNKSGQIKTFPVVEMEFNQEANLVEFQFSPALLSEQQEKHAEAMAAHIAEKLELVGILAVEMFVTKSGEILVNEMAPRPHNSGHQTIEGNITSQYEQHLRAICNLPLGNTAIIIPAVMINILGEKEFSGPAIYQGLNEVMQMSGTYVHLYGKTETKPFRKMGHCTVIHSDLETAKNTAREVMRKLKVIADQ